MFNSTKRIVTLSGVSAVHWDGNFVWMCVPSSLRRFAIYCFAEAARCRAVHPHESHGSSAWIVNGRGKETSSLLLNSYYLGGPIMGKGDSSNPKSGWDRGGFQLHLIHATYLTLSAFGLSSPFLHIADGRTLWMAPQDEYPWTHTVSDRDVDRNPDDFS